MKLLLSICMVLLTASISQAQAPRCMDLVGFDFAEPAYAGERTLWTSLRVLFEQGATHLDSAAPNMRKAGLCVVNLFDDVQPSEAVTSLAPAMLMKHADKVAVLFQKSYSQTLPAWAYSEKACMAQLGTFNKIAEVYIMTPATKIMFSKVGNLHTMEFTAGLVPTVYEVKVVGNNYIVKKDTSEYCIFSAN